MWCPIRRGEKKGGHRRCHAIPQDRLVDVLVRKIQTTVLTSSNLERLRAALHSRLDQQRLASTNCMDAVRKQLSNLNREIERGVENFLKAPTEVLEIVGEKLTALKRQRDHLEKELQAGEVAKQPKSRDVGAEIDAVVGRLWRLGEDLAKAELARRREFVRLLVSRIDLRFDKVQRGKRTECPFRSGEIHLRTEGEGSINRGDRRWTFPNESADLSLLWQALSQTIRFTADAWFIEAFC